MLLSVPISSAFADSIPCAHSIESVKVFHEDGAGQREIYGLSIRLSERGQRRLSKQIRQRLISPDILFAIGEKTFASKLKNQGDGTVDPEVETILKVKNEAAAKLARKELLARLSECQIVTRQK